MPPPFKESFTRDNTYDEVAKAWRIIEVNPAGGGDQDATEATLLAFKDANHADFLLSHAKLDTANLHLADIETATESLDTKFDVLLSTRATEATLVSFKDANHTDLLAVISALNSIDTSVGNVDTTLAAFKLENNTNLNDIEADIEAFQAANHADFLITQGKQDTANTHLQEIELAVENIDDKFDVNLSTRATEATLAAFKAENDTNLDIVNANLTSIDTSVGNVDTTLTAFKAENNTNLNDIEADLEAINLKQTDGLQKTQIVDGSNVTVGANQQDDYGVQRFPVENQKKVRPGQWRKATTANMKVDGSVTPQEFSITPTASKKYRICTVQIYIRDGSMNFNKFGGLSALTNGIQLKVAEGGVAERDVFSAPVKVNAGFFREGMNPDLKTSQTDILIAKLHLQESAESAFELTTGEYLKLIVNDDLTGLDDFYLITEGYEVAI